MSISFVIPVLNGDRYIRQCIDSIIRESAGYDEIIVVDNGSTDDTVKIVSAYENVRLLVYPKLTVAALRNRGATESSKPLLAFIDADCVLGQGWKEQVMAVMKDDSVHATGSRVDIPDKACWIEKAWFSQKPDRKRIVKYINTGNLIVRRDVFENLGGFNEALVSDEDCEFGERLNEAGYRILEDPAIRVIHLDNPTNLKEFYRREKWHATSALRMQTLVMLDRPTMMSLLFGAAILLSLVSIVASFWMETNPLWITLLILILPLGTAFYRAYQFNSYRFIPQLTLLWGVFYVVRLDHMLGHLFSKRSNVN